MAQAIAVRVVAAGLLQGALSAALGQHPELRVVARESTVVLLEAADGWHGLLHEAVSSLGQPDARAIVLLTDRLPTDLTHAVRHGLQVFVSMHDSEEELLRAVESAASRRAFCSRALQPDLMDGLRSAMAMAPLLLAENTLISGLSLREREVVIYALQGLTNSEIAGRLHLSVGTVKAHLRSAYRKLGIARRGQLRAHLLLPSDSTQGTGQGSV